MTTRQLEAHCAKSAAQSGKYLASAYAIIDANLPYFLELRDRLNAQGQRGVEGWAKWCERHFTRDVRTVNRALSAVLGPEKERKKPLRLRPVLDAFASAIEPAIRLARKHKHDPESCKLLNALEVEELAGFVPVPSTPDYFADKRRYHREVLEDAVYKLGVTLAKAIVTTPDAVRSDTPEGKKILGLANNLMTRKPPDNLSRSSVGDSLNVED